MDRRQFGSRIAAGALGALAASSPRPAGELAASEQRLPPRRNTLMHVGGDYHTIVGGSRADPVSPATLDYNLRHGIRHLTAKVGKKDGSGAWDRAEMRRMRDACDGRGVVWEAIRMDDAYIRMAPGAERDRELAAIRENVRRAAEHGVRVITYHWRVIPIRRNRSELGRGGCRYPGFELEDDWRSLPVGPAGKVSHEDYWERITTFLEAVIPVAQEVDVLMACHPYDPPGLPFGYQGAENWDSPDIFAAIKRYEAVVDSRHNGFQLCLGTVGEGLRNPREEILPIVRYLGERGKIHQVHARNIRGGLHDFLEVFPDEGDMDFKAILRILRDTGFQWSLCPDHMPAHPEDPDKLQAFAQGYGYLAALIQSVNEEVAM